MCARPIQTISQSPYPTKCYAHALGPDRRRRRRLNSVDCTACANAASLVESVSAVPREVRVRRSVLVARIGCVAVRKEAPPRLGFALRAPCPVPLVPDMGHEVPQAVEVGTEDRRCHLASQLPQQHSPRLLGRLRVEGVLHRVKIL